MGGHANKPRHCLYCWRISSHLRGAWRPGETGTSNWKGILLISQKAAYFVLRRMPWNSLSAISHSDITQHLFACSYPSCGVTGERSKCWTILFRRQTPTWPNVVHCNPISMTLRGINASSYKIIHGNVFNREIMNYLSRENFLFLNLQYSVRLYLCSLGLHASRDLRIMNKPLKIILIVEL